jgi:hypothetical protein
MHIILDRQRLERVLPVVRNRGPAAKKAPFLRLDAHQGELTISGLAAEAVIPAVVEAPGVLFIRATILRSLLEGLAGEGALECRVTEEAFMVGNLRLPMNPKSLVYFPDRAKAPRTLPGTDRVKVRYGAVVEIRKNKGTKAGARAREDKARAAMPLFDREITQGFELRPPSRAVTRPFPWPAPKQAQTKPPVEEPGVPIVLDGKPSVYKFTPDQLRAVVLSVLGATWRDRRDVIAAAASCLGYRRVSRAIHWGLADVISNMLKDGRLAADGRWIRKAGAAAAAPPDEPGRPSTIKGLDRPQLNEALLAVVGPAWIERDEAIRLAARRLGFGRCGKRILAAFASALTGLLRQGRLEYDGSLIRGKG